MCAKVSIAFVTVEKSRSSWVFVEVLRAGGAEDGFVGVCLSCSACRGWKGLEFAPFHVMLTGS